MKSEFKSTIDVRLGEEGMVCSAETSSGSALPLISIPLWTDTLGGVWIVHTRVKLIG